MIELRDILSGLAILVSVVSAFLAKSASDKSQSTARESQRLQEQLNESSRNFQQRLAEESKRWDDRRFITFLWEKIERLNDIDPKNVVEADVRNAINSMEAVAVCWQAGIVDKQMVIVAFGKQYEHLYDRISLVPSVPPHNKSGLQLLKESRPLLTVRDEIQQELNRRGAIT